MLKNMLGDLEKDAAKQLGEINMPCMTNCLLQGVKTKTYIPLMKRNKCGKIYFCSLHNFHHWNVYLFFYELFCFRKP